MKTDKTRRIFVTTSRRVRGFTLLETLAAIAILTVSLSVLAQIAFRAINESVVTRRRAQAILLTQARMEEILANRADIEAWRKQVTKNFTADPKTGYLCYKESDKSIFQWSYEINDAANNSGMKEITVCSYWPKRNQAQWSKCELRTMIFAPGKGPRLLGESGERTTPADGRES